MILAGWDWINNGKNSYGCLKRDGWRHIYKIDI